MGKIYQLIKTKIAGGLRPLDPAKKCDTKMPEKLTFLQQFKQSFKRQILKCQPNPLHIYAQKDSPPRFKLMTHK